MAFVGVLLGAILASFIVVRVGGFALQLTGVEPEVARFQALSAFSRTGFTTIEAEQVVQHPTRRRLVSILMVLGNAGLVTIIASLVASFTQVAGISWFFVQLGIIVIGTFIFYRLVLRSKVGNRFLFRLQQPLIQRMIREAPVLEQVVSFGRGWGVYLTSVKPRSKCLGMRVGAVEAGTDIEVLAIDRADEHLPRPPSSERLRLGDRLLVYGRENSITAFLGKNGSDGAHLPYRPGAKVRRQSSVGNRKI